MVCIVAVLWYWWFWVGFGLLWSFFWFRCLWFLSCVWIIVLDCWFVWFVFALVLILILGNWSCLCCVLGFGVDWFADWCFNVLGGLICIGLFVWCWLGLGLMIVLCLIFGGFDCSYFSLVQGLDLSVLVIWQKLVIWMICVLVLTNLGCCVILVV